MYQPRMAFLLHFPSTRKTPSVRVSKVGTLYMAMYQLSWAMYEELVISGKGLKNLWNTDARKVGTLVHCQPPRAKVGTLYIAQCTNFRNVPTGFGTWQCTMYRLSLIHI